MVVGYIGGEKELIPDPLDLMDLEQCYDVAEARINLALIRYDLSEMRYKHLVEKGRRIWGVNREESNVLGNQQF